MKRSIANYKYLPAAAIVMIVLWAASASVLAQDPKKEAPPVKPTLVAAVMCEEIDNLAPRNPAVVFSISEGKVSCFTSFDPVPAKTYIYHSWFHQENLITTKRLTLNPPRWSTFSRVQLRKADKGPWRVEVNDQQGNLLHVLRFSITN